MLVLSQYRKAVGAFLALLSTWGVTSSEDGIDGVEWWGLVGVIGGALLVERLSNEKPPVDRDAGMTAVEGLVIGLVLILLAALLFGGINSR